MFLEPLAECSFILANVCVSAVVVTCDVVDGPTLVFFLCLLGELL